MKTIGNLKKYVVDNKLDKDGCADPRITLTLDVKFQVHIIRALADLTSGDVLNIKIERVQMDMNEVNADVTEETPDEGPRLLTDGYEELEPEAEDASEDDQVEDSEEATG
jgi:hypothetical protein